MGAADFVSRPFGEYFDAIRRLIEPQLMALNLGESQIAGQSMSELKDSLDRINEAIKNPEQFGSYGIKVTGTSGVVISRSPAEGNLVLGALPILLQRKKEILDRMRILAPEEQLADAQEVVTEKVADPEVRAQLNAMLEEFAQKQRTLAEESQKSSQSALDSALLEIEIKERKWRMRRSLIEREPVAILIGAVILVVIAVALVVGMFTKVEVPQILSNAFLVILGYFFGQSSSGERRPDNQGNQPAGSAG